MEIEELERTWTRLNWLLCGSWSISSTQGVELKWLLSSFITLVIDGVSWFCIRCIGNGMSEMVFTEYCIDIHSRSPFDLYHSKNQLEPIAPEQIPIGYYTPRNHTYSYTLTHIHSFFIHSHPRYNTPHIKIHQIVSITLGTKRTSVVRYHN